MMTKDEFITKLKKKLDMLEKSEIDDIVEEYEGYIEEKKVSGMSEKEAVASLGNIDEITKDLLSAYKIKENYHDNSNINIINKFTDAVLDGIDSFINIFKGKDTKDIARIIIQIFLLFVIISMCKIPFLILESLGNDTFMVLGQSVGEVLSNIWRVILELIYFALAVIFFFKILKERIINENIDEENIEICNENKEEKSFSKYYNENPKPRNIKRAAKDSQKLDIIGLFANMLVWFIKFFVIIIAICNAFYIVGISFCVAISIYLLIKGITYFGLILLFVALLIFGISFFELFMNFIFDKKQKYTRFIITILSSLIIGGIGMGLFAAEISQTTFNKRFDENSYKIVEEIIPMEENLIIPEFYNIKIDNNLNNDIKVEYKYMKDYIDLDVESTINKIINENNYMIYHPGYNLTWDKKMVNKFLEDIKNKTFYNYEDLVKIKVYVNEQNYKKLQENMKKYNEYVDEDRYCFYNEDGIEICE